MREREGGKSGDLVREGWRELREGMKKGDEGGNSSESNVIVIIWILS